MSYAEYIRNNRRELGMTQDELAQRLGVARTTIVAIEAGQRRLRAEEFETLQQIGFPYEQHEPEKTDEKTWMRVSNDEREFIVAYRGGYIERIIRMSIIRKDSIRHDSPLPFDEEDAQP